LGYLAFFVSSAMCPDASNPVMVPAVKRLAKRSIKVILFQKKDITHKDRIQFHPAGAPVPLSGENWNSVKEILSKKTYKS